MAVNIDVVWVQDEECPEDDYTHHFEFADGQVQRTRTVSPIGYAGESMRDEMLAALKAVVKKMEDDK